MRQLKIGTSSVRGVVGESLTPEMMVDFASAFGDYCNGGTVVIGRDTRQSSHMLRAAVLAGLLSTGCRVIDLEVAPTPVVSFAIRDLQAAGGLSITGSHNDIEWNALKFIGPDGALLNAVSSEELLDIYHAGSFQHVEWHELQGCENAPHLIDRYLDNLLAALDVKKIRAQNLRVAVDFCNGSGTQVVMNLLQKLGCSLLPLNEHPESEFAHSPAPTIKNMRQLSTLMPYLDADIGVAINIDGDRIGFVQANGAALSEEYSFPVIADYLLSRNPGPIVTNYSTSSMIDEVARKYQQPVVRTFIGEGHVIDKAFSEQAAIAGEGSGGIAVFPVVTAFDAFYSLGLILEAIAVTGESLQALAERLPVYSMRKGVLSCPPNLIYRVLEGVREHYTDFPADYSEGVRVEFPDAWLHVRASNTEPLLRVQVEAKQEDKSLKIFEEVMEVAQQIAFGRSLSWD